MLRKKSSYNFTKKFAWVGKVLGYGLPMLTGGAIGSAREYYSTPEKDRNLKDAILSKNTLYGATIGGGLRWGGKRLWNVGKKYPIVGNTLAMTAIPAAVSAVPYLYNSFTSKPEGDSNVEAEGMQDARPRAEYNRSRNNNVGLRSTAGSRGGSALDYNDDSSNYKSSQNNYAHNNYDSSRYMFQPIRTYS